MITKFNADVFEQTKSTDNLPLECEFCHKIFYVPKKSIAYESKTNRGRLKYCSRKCFYLYCKQQSQITYTCCQCGKTFTRNKGAEKKSISNLKFCSHKCANIFLYKQNTSFQEASRQVTHATRQKVIKNKSYKQKKVKPKQVKTKYSKNKKEYICKVCGKTYTYQLHTNTKVFCSKNCQEEYWSNKTKYLTNEALEALHKAGLKSVQVQKENKRSKNEIYFCELCEEYFKSVFHNEPMFNGWDADIIIPSFKIAVLWNGNWHYKEISKKVSLKQIQNRDAIKEKAIKENGYEVYIIKDLGKYNPHFVKDEFNKFLKFINDKNLVI